MEISGNNKELNDVNLEISHLINLFRQSPIAIEVYDKNGRLLDVNQACLDLFGLKNTEAVKGFNLFEDPNLPEQAIIDIRSGNAVKYEFTFSFELVKSKKLYETTKEGSSFLECYINPSKNRNNEIDGYIVHITDISERKLAEEEILESKELLALFVKHSPIYTFVKKVTPTQSSVLIASENYREMIGIPGSEMAGKNMFELFPEEFAEKITADDWAVTDSGEILKLDEDLNDRHYTTIKFPIIRGADKYLAGYTIDITERKQAEAAFRKSEENYRSLIHYSSDPIFSFNPDYSYRFVNEAFATPFGKKPEDIIGKTPFDIFSTDEANKRLTIVRQVFRTEEKCEIEVRVDTISGEIRYYLTMVDPIKNDSGQVLYVTCISKNITERKMAEEALRKSEEKFRRIVESSTGGMYFYHLEEDNRLIFSGANPAADRIIGISHQSLFGKTVEEAFPELASTEYPSIYKSIAKGERGPCDFDIEYADDLVSGFYNVQVFQTESNTITVHFVDISDRKNTERLLEIQAKELRELNATKDKFLSIIAHDLKNPFNAIIGFSDLMLVNFNQLDEETIHKGLKTIQSASGHAYKLLENLLLWSQNKTGLRQFNPEKFNLTSQVLESVSMVESAAISKGIQIVVNIKKAYPVFADKNMIDSVLRNLITNAIKFSHKWGKIIVSATKTEHEIQITVTDKGVGISPERQTTIFEIDKHSHTVGTDNEQGTGLGLILCKDFIEKHGGKIRMESKPGKGSKFIFSLSLN